MNQTTPTSHTAVPGDDSSTLVPGASSVVVQKLMSDETYVWTSLVFSVVCTVLSLLGIVGNARAIRAFLSMGLRDGVTISFLFLTCSDLAYLTALAVHAVSLGFAMAERWTNYRTWFSVEPFGVYVFFSNVGILIYLLTVLTTTYLALAKCMCVAMPLHFKNTFTRKRTLVILTVFLVLTVGSYLPVLVYMRMVDKFDPRTNSTRSVLWISSKRDDVRDYVWLVRDVTVTFVTQIIVTFCVIIMVRCLRVASNFRQKFIGHRVCLARKVIATDVSSYNKNSTNSDVNTTYIQTVSQRIRLPPLASPPSVKLSSADVSVIQQVVLISFVYIGCNTPKLLVDLTAMLVPDFTLGRPYQNVYLTAISMMELCQGFNSSISFVIYHRYNTSFRQHCGWGRK
ncbi:uncharacterized protein LOC131939312 [Physella acuta]|uniref:uncharacterized protein LOC131939312 n=1 Tax=Physella acuta TaxID=109671 RepID=UPI0027DB3275|nr:uncharacterized protein LOC131939312 [Physella acuta]